jgi:hypothetical protein
MSLAIREMKIKPTMRYYFVSTRKSAIKHIIMRIGSDMEKLQPSCTIGWNVRWRATLKDILAILLVVMLFDPVITLLFINSRKIKYVFKQKLAH